ncbi:hypothetical protein [Bdellovibrio sp. HCB274]|uniref:hypothetical protein n=1 Tax=Bdellovibrio sp. HCB274 TaxID=3394361 RepID=UPI0039B39CFD
MFNKEVFKNHITKTQKDMTSSYRGKIDTHVEKHVINGLSEIYLTMADRYAQAAAEGADLPVFQQFADQPKEQHAYLAMQDLIERMELDFTQKLVLNVKHDIEKDIEICKIQISFLDSVRRHLNGAKAQ